MKKNEYETIYNDDKKEFLIEKEEDKKLEFLDSKIIDENNENEKLIDNNNSNEEENEIDDSEFGFKYDAYKESNIISRLFFFWAFYILRLSTKKKIKTKIFWYIN